MKKLIPLAIILLFFSSCGSKKESKSKLQTQLDELDTLYLIANSSGLEINRYRQFNHKNEMFRVGKMGFNFSLKDLKIHSKANYTIDSGYIIYNKKSFTAKCYLSTSQISVPVIDSTKNLKIGTPGYLNTASKFIVFEYRGNFFPFDQSPTSSLFITLNDSTGLVTECDSKIKLAYAKKNKTIKSIESAFNLNGLEWKLFEPENKSEIEKDSICASLKLIF